MRGESKATTRIIDMAVSILEQQNPMTVRQLFYRLVGAGEIGNTQAEYHRVSRFMVKARRDGRCDYDWIVDRSRPTYTPNVWNDAAQYFETVKKSYRRDYWQDQPCYCEVWTEKDAIIGSIEPVTNALGVTVRVFRGFSSETRAHDVEEILGNVGRTKDVHIFYLGDHDPSGRGIEEDLYTRTGGNIKRIAIHKEDIGKFKLPPQRIKLSDTRAKTFHRIHGQDCVELDALPPVELRRRLEDAIWGIIEPASWNRHVNAETVERQSIVDFVAALHNSKSGPQTEAR